MQLVERAQDGDTDSLNRLLERYFHRVRTIVRARMGPRLRRWSDSGDVIQQTFIAAVHRLESFEMRNDAALINWLAKIAENRLRDIADKMSAEKRRDDIDVPLEELGSGPGGQLGGFDIASDATAPLDAVVDHEEQALLEAAMAALDEEHRELILLRDYMGHSWSEVAEHTGGSSADAARMRYATARARLTILVAGSRHRQGET